MIEKILLNKTSVAIPLYPVAVCTIPYILSFSHLFWTTALKYKIDKAFIDVSLNEKCTLSFNILYLILINLQIKMKYTPITKHRKVCLFVCLL